MLQVATFLTLVTAHFLEQTATKGILPTKLQCHLTEYIELAQNILLNGKHSWLRSMYRSTRLPESEYLFHPLTCTTYPSHGYLVWMP